MHSLLFFGQRDLFEQSYVEISVYRILQTLGLDTTQGQNYRAFRRDMERAFTLFVKTDRFRDPQTGQRSHIDYFRILSSMRLAKHHNGVSRFHFDAVFLASLRSGYLTRLELEYCLDLDRQGAALARFLYGHLTKRRGAKSLYQRKLTGFLGDVGLGHWLALPPKDRNKQVRQVLYPALNLVKGHGFADWRIDEAQNLVIVP